MSESAATNNTESLVNQGEFQASRGPSAPQQTSGHQPGKLVGNDAAPEFHAQTLPAGSAPAESTFQPNPTDDVPAAPKSGSTAASHSIPGSTSADVHTGLGKPAGGMTSQERHHTGPNRGGLEGAGATVTAANTVDAHDPKFADQRALDKDDAVLKNSLGGAPAEEL